MSRTHVNEMNVQAINLGDELRQGIESCFYRLIGGVADLEASDTEAGVCQHHGCDH